MGVLLAIPLWIEYLPEEQIQEPSCEGELIEYGIGITVRTICYHPDSTYTPFIQQRINEIRNEKSNHIN